MFWKLEAEKYSVHTNLCPLATEILAPCGYTSEWYSHADFNKDLNISPICRIKAPQYCMLLKCIICVANWKLSRQSKCHKKMTLLRIWESLDIPFGNIAECPQLSSMFIKTADFCGSSHTCGSLVVKGTAGSLDRNFTFSKNQAGHLPRNFSTP